MKMLKKSVAILLAAMMLIGSLSVLSFAALGDGTKTSVAFDTVFYRNEGSDEEPNWVPTTKAAPGEKVRARFFVKTDYEVSVVQTLYAFDKSLFTLNEEFTEVTGYRRELSLNPDHPVVAQYGLKGIYNPGASEDILQWIIGATESNPDDPAPEIPQSDQDQYRFITVITERPWELSEAPIFSSDEWLYELEFFVNDDVAAGTTGQAFAYQPHFQTDENWNSYADVSRVFDNGDGTYSAVNAGDWMVYGYSDHDVQYTFNDDDASSTLTVESTVTFNGNGGTIDGEETVTASGIVGTAIGNGVPAAQPAQEGKNFLGWSTDAEATKDDALLSSSDIAALTFPYTDDVVYYAIYEDSDASFNLNLYVQNADGSWPETPTTSNIGAATGTVVNVTADGVTAVVDGEAVTYYAAPEHFAIDPAHEGATATATVAAGEANPVNVYVNRAQYTVTFDGEGSPAYYEAAGTAPDAAPKTGYTFDKWVNAADDADTLAKDAAYTVTGDKAYTSTYTPNPYDAIFDANGGKFGDETQTTVSVNYDADITAPAENPVYTGYNFLGWAATDDATEGLASLGKMDDVNGKTFYAVWTPNNYTATFYAEDGLTVIGTPAEVAFGAAIPTPEAPTVAGKTFAGWNPPVPATMPAENQSFTATYTLNDYTIHYEYVNAPDGVTQLADVTAHMGDAIDLPDYSEYLGGYSIVYTLTDEYGEIDSFDLDGGLRDYDVDQSDVTVTIAFTANQFTIHYFDDDVAASPVYVQNVPADKSTVTYGAAIPTDYTLNGTEYKKAGQVFKGWTFYLNGAEFDATTETMPASDLMAYANWMPIAYVVTVNGLNGEDIGYSQSYSYNQIVDLPTDEEMAVPGYTFDGWEYDPTDVVNADNRITKDSLTDEVINLTISAQYTPEVLTVRFDADGGTIDGQPYVDVTGFTVDQEIDETLIPGMPVKPGYHLADDALTNAAYWDAEGVVLSHDEIFDGTPEGIAMVFTPIWIENEVTVNFNPQGGTFVAPLPDGATESEGIVSITGYADKAMTAPTVEQTGYASYYWSAEPNGTPYDVSKFPAIDEESITLYAVWSADEFTVTYQYSFDENVKDADKEAAPAAETYAFGAEVTSPAPITKDGYTISGWTYEPALADGTMPASNVTATATWTAIPYTLTYTVTGTAPADFVAPVDNAPHYIGDTVTLAAVTPVDGYTFDGWKLNDADVSAVTFGTANIEVTGEWTKVPYTLTYAYDYENVKDADKLEAPAAVTLTIGDDIPAVAAAEKTGYTVTEWKYFDGSNNEITDGKMPAGPVLAKATQSGIPYTLTYEVTGTAPAGFVTPTDSTPYFIGDTATLATVTAVDGYTFDGWKLNGADATSVTFADANITVTGEWTKIPYTLTYAYEYENVKDADKLEAPAAVTLTVGDDIPAVAAAEKTGYTVTEWKYYDANDVEITDGKMPAGDVTAKATQSGIAYSLTYTVTGDGPADFVAPVDNTDYYIGDTATLATVAAADGFTFDGWKLNDATVADVTFADADIEVTGAWTRNDYTITYQYTFDANVKEADKEAAPAAETYAYDAAVAEKTPIEKAGYTISAWTYEPALVDGKMPASNVTATATWTANPYHLSYAFTGVTPDGAAAPTDNETYYVGDVVTLAPVAPVEGYTFGGWKLDGADVSEVTFADADIAVTGNWTINRHMASFYDDTNTRLSFDEIAYGQTFDQLKPEDPDMTGYTFEGWIDSTNFDAPTAYVAGMTMPDHDVEFHLTRTPIDYQITFVKDGETVYDEMLPYNSEIPEPEVETFKTGYEFLGWFNGDEEFLPGTTLVSGDATYTAVYEGTPVNYSIVKNFQDADWNTPAGSDYVAAAPETATGIAGDPVNVVFADYDNEAGFTLDTDASTASIVIAGDGSSVINLYYTRNTVTGTIDGVEDQYYVGQVIDSAEVQNPDPGLNYTGWKDADTDEAVTFPYTVPNNDFNLVPVSEANLFTLTFVEEDGETVIGEAQQVAYGAEIAGYKPADPEKEGYEFSGWSDAETGEQMPATMPAKNATYKANFRADSNTNYAIKIYVMDISGNYTTATSTVATGATGAPVTIQPGEMTGYVVNYDRSHLTGYIAGDGSTVLDIYYDRASYNVTFYDEDQTTVLDGPTAVFYGATIPTPAETPTKVGSEFVKWVDADGNDVPATMPAGDQAFYATYTPGEYTITYIVNGAQTVVTYAYGAEVTAPEDPSISGMTFIGWTPEVPETMPAENLIIVAEFDKAAYNVTFEDYDGTVILTTLVDVGSPIGKPSTDPSREYYTFAGWDGYTDGMTMPAQDVTFTALYERVPVKLIPKAGSTTVIERVIDGETVIESYNDDSVTTAGYDADDFTAWYVYGLEEMANDELLLSDYLDVQGDGSITIEPRDGRNGFYGTGATITVTDNVTGEVVETFTIIIFGDLNGDAYVTSVDTTLLRNELNGNTEWSWDDSEEYNAARVRAADLNGDGSIRSTDRGLLNSAVLGSVIIDQTTGLTIAL